ncbi:MAG: CoB--CoM heterodisulfide reductase iron-sulfur subunit A family protein [Deltaproteobacteria bacterium]|nr:CoB--CoM heterodisulfide reductase iron-sulfur subunit A family protein [Deltaproteobacteria bacterium]
MKNSSRIIVIGGGIAGLTAAENLAEIGWEVLIIERTGHLGGHGHHWACMATSNCNRCSACAVFDRVGRVLAHDKISVLTLARVASLKGEPWAFKVRIEPEEVREEACRSHPHLVLSQQREVCADFVVVATGFTPYDAKESPLLGYGRFPEVLTTLDVDEMLLRNHVQSFLKPDVSDIAFVQCVGSRDKQAGRDYCSQFCCKTSLRLARKLLYERPDLEITLYYIDLQVTGKEFRHFLKEMSGRMKFIQGTPAEISHGETEGKVIVKRFDPSEGKASIAEHDRVVLSIGQVASPENKDMADALGLDVAPDGFLALSEAEGSRVSTRPGVFLVGACSGPADLNTSSMQALAATTEIGRPAVMADTYRTALGRR